MTVEEILRLLNLKRHPLEGGFFIETYRSNEKVPFAIPANEKKGFRSLSTAIYYLLTPETFSEMHRLPADEIFHFYLGDPVEMLLLFPYGQGLVVTLGHDIPGGHFPQQVVPKYVWQGSRLVAGGRFALLGTTVAPGFETADYESGNAIQLASLYPEFSQKIRSLTRQKR